MSDNQVPFATLGNAIGFITKLDGSVTVQSIDGQERVVKLGDPIFFGETVLTGGSGSVTIAFVDGTDVVIGGDSIVEMTDEIYNTGDNEDLVADSSSEIDALQSAILAGDDPTLIQDAPAAGNTLADQQRVDVSIERNDNSAQAGFGVDTQSSLPTYGYDTDNGDGVRATGSEYSAPSSERTLNQSPLLINLDIDPITGDSVINAAEAGGTVTLTGVVNGDVFSSGVVTLVINGVTYSTNVNPNGTWSVSVAGSDLSADSDRIVDASVVVTNGAGQQGTADSTESFIVKTSSRATIRVNSITSDDVVNAEESNSTITVSGRVGLDASAGDTVSMTINGTLYTTVVLANKTWSVGVSGSDLAQDNSFQVSVTGQDGAGNPYAGTTTSTHTVDLAATAGTVTVNAITSDDVINATEAAGTVAVAGTATGGDIAEGDTVTLVINGTTYTTEVDENGEWSVDVAGSDLAADTAFDAVVTSSDAAGNTVDTTGSSTHTVDTSAVGQIDIDRITSDSVINSDESSSGNLVAITGYVGNDAMPGDTISITLDGVVIGQGTVSEDQNSNGKYLYSVNVLGSDLANTTLVNPSIVVTVSGEDAAGNAFTAQSTEIYKVDTFADVEAFVSEESGDNVINLDEVGNLIVGGWVESEGVVTSITITDSSGNSITITDGISTEDDGSGWDYFEKNVDVSTLADGQLSVVVNTVDASGNTGSSEPQLIEKDTVADSGTVTIDPITSDDTIDGIELGQTISISGKAVGGDISVGDVVKMTINNTEYSTTVKAGGIWIIAGVLGSDLAADSEFNVVVTSSDAAGNKVESIGTSTHSVDLSAEANFSLAEGQQHILTDLPEGFAFPDGTTEVVTNFGGTITLGDDGEYRYDAPVRDHGDAVSDKDSVTVTLEDGRTFTVNLDIQDSAPVAVDDQDSIVVQHEEFEVSEIAASWVSYTHGESVTTFDGTSDLGGVDNDSAKDQIRWGNPAESKQSGYGFIDNDSNLEGRFDLNQDISVGTFTHYNYPVYSGGAITSAEMSVEFSVLDHLGVSTPVTLTVNFDHNETPNTNDVNSSRDIVTVQNTHVTFERDGDIYTVQIVGFREVGNPDGEVVTSIYTNENAATSYELVVRVVEGDGYSLPSTEGNIFDDNGLGADSLGADGSVIVVGVAVGATVSSNDSVGHSIEGQYGNLVLNSDGSYVYEVTASVSDIPAGATESFAYLIQDQDGSTSSANLSINVGTNTAPKAQDDSTPDSLFAGLVGEYYGTNSQLENISDFRALVVSKEADATFEAANISYGRGSSDVAKGTHLQEFLGSDASTLSTDPGDNTDGGIYLQGYVYLEAGTYNFKVTADDGYEITINGNPVATVESNQSVHTVTHASFTISESGYQAIDMIWWDQGGDYMFQPVLSSDGGDTYFVLDASILSSTGETPLATSSEQALAISVDSLLENDTDADGDALTVTSISNVQNGYAYLNSEGVIHFTPLQGFSGVATFDYTVSDGKGGKDTATASIDVTADGILPTVSVSVSSSNSLNLWNGFTVEADITHSFNDYSSSIAFGNANNKVYVADDVKASLTLGTGDDELYVGDDLRSSGNIDLGTGDDKLFVADNVYGSIDAGTGNDDISIGGNVHAYVNTGTGNDNLSVGGDVESTIDTGTGNDDVYIGGDVKAYISTGTGNDNLSIDGSVSSTIDTGTDNDAVYIGGNVNAYVSTGTGNDTLTIKGNVGHVSVFLDTGDDFLVISGAVNSGAWIDGGTGTDSIVLENYTTAQYYLNYDNIQTRVVNFENIMLSDGVVKGDAGVFDNYNSSAFSYSLTIDIDNTDSTTESSIVTLFGIPLTASLTLANEPLVANLDGSYDIEITSGQTSIDDLKILSDIELPDLDITSVVAFDTDSSDTIGASPDEDNLLGLADDSYIVGTDGIDTLVGGLGDDVLFGGDDEATDILTGLEGKDIFILGDTTEVLNIDTITDFNAAEDALDLTDLLTGIEGSPGKDADTDLITEFLSQHVKVTDGNVKVDGEDVATFIEERSSFDSNNDGLVNSSDSIKVIYNNEEYSINIDG